MLNKVELYEVQDKVRVMDELNEIVDAVNGLEEKVENLMKAPKASSKPQIDQSAPITDTRDSGSKKKK